ncbi:STE20-related kinase adapter protein alpha [Acipenser ruthenus]|uniref:STE20-related kinase adapter protein alpha n=1 Tax=Acipenser ruthenus TaxID=7906 RepID=A0A444UBL5_ACIRT|nr:STE20-related kinase adapter protein alpha [Acipenser ruthenus]
MLLEKLNGTVPCLLDTSTIPLEELRLGADPGACGLHPTKGEPSPHPYNRTFSTHFHSFVELCLQRDPERRWNPKPDPACAEQSPNLTQPVQSRAQT